MKKSKGLTAIDPMPPELKERLNKWAACRLLHEKVPIYTENHEIVWVCKEGCDEVKDES